MPITPIPLEKDPTNPRYPSVPEHVKAHVLQKAVADPDWGGPRFDWNRWHGLPTEFFKDLPLSDQVVLAHSDVIMSNLSESLEKAPETFLLNRVRLCLWYYGTSGTSSHWNSLVEAYTKTCTFDFGEPNFTTEIDHPRGFQGRGTGECSKRWLDGALAYRLFYKGEEVATLAFSLTGDGVLIQQAQMIQKKGNRWAYKLPGTLLDVMVDKFQRHFDCPIWIVDGASQADYLNKVHPIPVEEIVRIARYYDAPIAGFTRTEKIMATSRDWYQTGCRSYHLLQRNEALS